MFFVFGWGKTTKRKVESIQQHCNVCGNETIYDALKVTKWFTLFFIPVIPYGKEFWWLCRNCQRGYKLDSEQAFNDLVAEVRNVKLKEVKPVEEIPGTVSENS